MIFIIAAVVISVGGEVAIIVSVAAGVAVDDVVEFAVADDVPVVRVGIVIADSVSMFKSLSVNISIYSSYD